MSCSRPFISDKDDVAGNPILIPCGTCLSCRVDYQRRLTDRLYCAWKCYTVSAFVTFTYDDEHLIIRNGFRQPTLSKDDLHKYLDKIKHQIDIPFEYYVCGEYGDSFSRPHYHGLFFGLDYELHAKFFKSSWKKGSVKVLPCASNAFRYVTKYITAPNDKELSDKLYFDTGRTPPFHKMSRALGAVQYYNHIDEIEKFGFFCLDGRKISCNRYYYNKLVHFNEDLITAKQSQIFENQRVYSQEATRYNLDTISYKKLQRKNKERALYSRSRRTGESVSLPKV